MSISLDEARWHSVLRRDREADGRFYYSVATSGVYCRPSCAGRARRDNVSFHDTAADAERAGFRPCKRCRPAAIRADTQAEIRYAVGLSPLGILLLASSGRGVCAILLGDAVDHVVAELAGRFPGARLVRDDGASAPGIAAVARAMETGATPDLALDLQGTEFQQRVWLALRAIPAGRTASYGEIARQIGRPGAVRAVAGACAANPAALAVPCHRVVRADGSLSGYRWGVARKRALLAREAGAAEARA